MLGGMKIYSDFPARRTFQIVADLLAVAVMALGIWLGVAIASTIAVFAVVGRQVESAGLGFQGAMADAGDVLGQLPLIGDAARAPFDSASGTGGALASAGSSTETFILSTSVVVGVIVAVAIVAIVLWVWLRRRIRFARRATEASRLAGMPGGYHLLALHALVGASKAELAAIAPDPAASWRAGDARVVRALAELELRRAGVRLPADASR